MAINNAINNPYSTMLENSQQAGRGGEALVLFFFDGFLGQTVRIHYEMALETGCLAKMGQWRKNCGRRR
jgi:hypothetical protein